MMQPKRTKFRKQFKGKISGSAQRGNTVAFGEFGLKATDRCRMTAREIEAATQASATPSASAAAGREAGNAVRSIPYFLRAVSAAWR